jgi:hypothetical protein
MATLKVNPTDVTGSQFSSAKTRVILDGVVVAPDGTFVVNIGPGKDPLTFTAQQLTSGKWRSIVTASIPAEVVVATPPPPDPVPTPPPTSGTVNRFTGRTAYDLALMCANMQQDVIEIPAGTYSAFQFVLRKDLRARPVTIRPVSGAKVYFDGAGVQYGGFGAIHLGSTILTGVGIGPTSNGFPAEVTGGITWDGLLDAAGSQFVFQNYNIQKDGLWHTGWVDTVGLNRLMARNNVGMGGSYSHHLYINSDGVDGANPTPHRGKNITSIGCDIVCGRDMNGVQFFHEPNVDGAIIKQWKASGGNTFAYAYSSATGVDFDGNVITNFTKSFESAQTIKGQVRNTRCSGCGAPTWGSPNLIHTENNVF